MDPDNPAPSGCRALLPLICFSMVRHIEMSTDESLLSAARQMEWLAGCAEAEKEARELAARLAARCRGLAEAGVALSGHPGKGPNP